MAMFIGYFHATIGFFWQSSKRQYILRKMRYFYREWSLLSLNKIRRAISLEEMIMRKYPLLFSSLIALLASSASLQAGYTTIVADTLQWWITKGTTFDFILIDARETSEATKVIATDVCKPYLLPWNTGVFKQTMNKLPKDAAIVIYCASGNRSGQAAKLLSDSGYSKVYSLTNGINNGWGSRPTKDASSIKPTDMLPEASMVKATVAIRYGLSVAHAEQDIRFSGNTFMVTAPVASPHALTVFNARGQCVASMQNPFASRTVCAAAGLRGGFFVARLALGEGRSVGAVRMVH
jgi:rhodanese-related sulfurtransferase